MGLIACPDCGRQVSDQAPACPQCARPMAAAPAPTPEPLQQALQEILQPKAKASSTNWFLWGCLVPTVVVFVGCLVSLTGDKDKRTELEQQHGSSTMAAIMCEDYVKQRLTSPGSADFASLLSGEVRIDSLGGGRYKVHSYVDAQNSFGALLRSQFVCRIAKVPGGDEWRLEDLEMER